MLISHSACQRLFFKINILGASILKFTLNVHMRSARSLLFLASLSLTNLAAIAAEGVFAGKTVAALNGGDSRPCAFFTLDGVPEAVSAVPGSPWFVLPIIHPKYKETFALLLSAKLSGRSVYVVTTGGVHSCGHAEVSAVTLL